MRTFNVSFLAVLSCIVMISATPIGNTNPIVDNDLDVVTCSGNSAIALININLDAKYIALQQLMEFLT